MKNHKAWSLICILSVLSIAASFPSNAAMDVVAGNFDSKALAIVNDIKSDSNIIKDLSISNDDSYIRAAIIVEDLTQSHQAMEIVKEKIKNNFKQPNINVIYFNIQHSSSDEVIKTTYNLIFDHVK